MCVTSRRSSFLLSVYDLLSACCVMGVIWLFVMLPVSSCISREYTVNTSKCVFSRGYAWALWMFLFWFRLVLMIAEPDLKNDFRGKSVRTWTWLNVFPRKIWCDLYAMLIMFLLYIFVLDLFGSVICFGVLLV